MALGLRTVRGCPVVARSRHFGGIIVHRMNQSRVAALIVGTVLIIVAIRVPAQPVDRDPVVFHAALNSMHAGQSYYPAMDAALLDAGIGPVSAARGFRSPWLFYFWWLLGGDRGLWFAYLAGVVGAVVAGRHLVDNQLALISPMVVLVGIGLGASMATESWAAPWILASVAFAVKERDKPAAACALVAVLARELALPVIIGGLMWSIVRRRQRWPWLLALTLAGVSFWLHAQWAAPYLREPGREAPLWGWMVTATSFPRFVGFGMPFGVLLGPLAAAGAWWQAWRRGWLPLIGPILAFGFLGIALERPYWGAIVTPLEALLATDLLLSAVRADRH